MKFKKEVLDNIRFHLILNILFILTVTLASYIHIPLTGFKDTLFYFIHMCILQSCFAGILYFISLNQLLFRLLFSIMYIVLGIVAFWVFSIDISISPFLIDACLQIESELVKDLISIPLILYIIFLFVALFIILKLYNKLEVRAFKFSTILSIVLILMIFVGEHIRHQTFQFKLPYQFFSSVYGYFNKDSLSLEDISNFKFSSNLESDIQVTFVLGETVRADHLSINGYTRNTTPNLLKLKNFISFKEMYTNKIYTFESIPQILSNQSIYDTVKTKIRSVYDVLKKSDVNCTWIGNQFLEWGYKPIANSNSKVILIDELKSYDSYHKSKDEELLPYLKQELEKDLNKNMTTLHMVGSHWWYDNRYDERHRKYKPVIDSKYLPSLTKEQIINSYDNTILYLDYFLNEVINYHKNLEKPSIVIYISDHGESLGENGKWLHGHKSKYVANPAFIIWYSKEFKYLYPKKIAYFNNLNTSNLSTDIIYTLILNLFEISQK